jgi:hypothetical protein
MIAKRCIHSEAVGFIVARESENRIGIAREHARAADAVDYFFSRLVAF